jgi:CHAD domain-containing protein
VPFVSFVDAIFMADEKWIPGLRGDMPVNAAAKLALSTRLGVVRDRLPAAVFHAYADVENVHQLRVGTRRAAAALRIFADCLPARLREKTRKTLRALRRSAGEARDWDVFLAEVEPRLARASARHRAGLLFLFGFAQGRRDLAQEHLQEAHTAKAEAFAACIDEVIETLDRPKNPEQRLRDLAGAMLNELLHELVSAARADLQSYDALHQVRILGKQLRYAMEIFESCYATEFRQNYYPEIVEMQDILGLANDSYTAWERLTTMRKHMIDGQSKQWKRCEPGIEMLLHFHERRLPQQRRKFEKWWRAWLKSGAETAFAELISNQ